MTFLILSEFTLSNDENEQLRMWEYASAEAYLNSSMLVASETLDERVKYIQSRYDAISNLLAFVRRMMYYLIARAEVSKLRPTSQSSTFY